MKVSLVANETVCQQQISLSKSDGRNLQEVEGPSEVGLRPWVSLLLLGQDSGSHTSPPYSLNTAHSRNEKLFPSLSQRAQPLVKMVGKVFVVVAVSSGLEIPASVMFVYLFFNI